MEIVVRQISGLGNQLFQYAAGRYYAQRYGAAMRMALDPPRRAHSHGIPRPFLLSEFTIASPVHEIRAWERMLLTTRPQLAPLRALLGGVTGSHVYWEPLADRHRFVEDIPVPPGARSLYLAGYWQTYRIAEALGDGLRSEFTFRNPPAGRNLELLDQIQQTATPVSLHVRRGDYTLASEGNLALPMDYYRRAISRVLEQFDAPTFFIFSDDIAFARANLPAGLRTVFVDHNDNATGQEDLRLMSHCHHHILANSSFSWWGAWLNPREDKHVYAPRQWHLKPESYYPDLVPPSWELLDVQGVSGALGAVKSVK